MKLVSVQLQVYLSEEEPNTQVPLLAQGVLARHVSVRIHEHREELNMYPGSQTTPQAIERKYMYNIGAVIITITTLYCSYDRLRETYHKYSCSVHWLQS